MSLLVYPQILSVEPWMENVHHFVANKLFEIIHWYPDIDICWHVCLRLPDL